MAGRVEGKVAFITGAGRGSGRSHAVRLAEEGADIIAIDVLEDIPSLVYSLATQADLDETVAQVESLGQKIIARKADVRDLDALKAVLDDGVAAFGHLDIVVANAGICHVQTWDNVTPEIWQDTLDVNLTGVWNTMAAAAPHVIASGGGSIIATSSTTGLKGTPYFGPYVAAKHGVVGIARSLAHELAKHHVRVNTVHPAGVATPLADGLAPTMEPLLASDPQLTGIFMNSYPVDIMETRDISNAVLFLASDEARYVTGLALTVDGANTIR